MLLKFLEGEKKHTSDGYKIDHHLKTVIHALYENFKKIYTNAPSSKLKGYNNTVHEIILISHL